MHTDQYLCTKRCQIALPALDSLPSCADLPVELQARDLELPVDNAVSDTFEVWLQGEDWSNPRSIQWVGHPSGTLCVFC
jgi:hypothetical protein